MTRKIIRTLIVDDSPVMRKLIRLSLASDPEIKVVAEAEDARAARDAVNSLKPDVMTLDVEMPNMNGLEFLRRLMRARPMPVVMVSSFTESGSEVAVRALSLGAVGCVAKPKSSSLSGAFNELAEILKVAASARIRPQGGIRSTGYSPQAGRNWNGKILLFGASTGGVEALETILSQFPEDCPPTLITQHMPAHFLKNFSTRLNGKCAPTIKLAENDEPVSQGKVLIAPGGDYHMCLAETDPHKAVLVKGPKRTGNRPSVDVLFSSAVPHARKIIATILTGMGADGAEGMQELRRAGAYCIAQDRESCVVYGMPRVACEKNGVDISIHLDKIAGKVLACASRSGGEAGLVMGGKNTTNV